MSTQDERNAARWRAQQLALEERELALTRQAIEDEEADRTSIELLKLDLSAMTEQRDYWQNRFKATESASDYHELAQGVGEFVRTVFPDHTPATCAIKCSQEAEELMDNPWDKAEAADVLITLLAWCSVSDVSADALVVAALDKMRVNASRAWERRADGTYQHSAADQ